MVRQYKDCPKRKGVKVWINNDMTCDEATTCPLGDCALKENTLELLRKKKERRRNE